jgi:hypothetical protein
MLSEFRVKQVWDGMLAAETRALYFAGLASDYTLRKQLITGVSFVFASGAVVTLLTKTPSQFASILASLLVAVLNGYSIAVGLDRKISTLIKLHSTWQQIANDYSHLWNHLDDPDAESHLEEIIEREREPSEIAATEAPYKPRLLEKWQAHVFASYDLGAKAASD